MLTMALYSRHHLGIVVESFVVIACRAWIGETEALRRLIAAPFAVAPLRLVVFRDALILEPRLSLRTILVMASRNRRAALVGSTESLQEIDQSVGRACSVEMVAVVVVVGEAAADEVAIEGALARF
jgi:hypothetical protein